MKKLRRLHKFIISLCVVSSLFFMNIFSFSASANGVEEFDAPVYTLGAPISCRYESFSQSGGEGNNFSGVIPLFNVFSYDSSADNSAWVGSLASYSGGAYDHFYQLHYYNPESSLATSDVDLSFTDGRRCQFSFYLDSPVIFKNLNELNSYFDYRVILQNVTSLLGVDPTDYPTNYFLKYSYTFASKGYTVGNGWYVDYELDLLDIPISSNQLYFDFFHPDVFNNENLSDIDQFYSSELDSYFYVLLFASVEISNVAASRVILNSFDYHPVLYEDYSYELASRNAAVINNDLVVDNINFSNLDWTDWLVNAVGGFMNFELVPGLSFAGMLGLLVGMSLFIVFLKIFAGG